MPDYRSYNNFDTFPLTAYNVIAHLIENNELIWKLLKYDDANAWKSDAEHPNLTKAEKGALIYDGQFLKLNNYRVFLDIGQDQAFTKEACILRVSPVDLYATNYVYGDLVLGLEVYCHYEINTMSNYQTRTDKVTQQLIETLNGVEIEGVGQLFFDRTRYGGKSSVIGQIPFKGRGTIMCNNVLG